EGKPPLSLASLLPLACFLMVAVQGAMPCLEVLTDLKSTTSAAQSAMGTAVPILTPAPAGTPSGGWREFAVRRNGLTSATTKPAEPLEATARLYLARSGSSWSSLEPAA